MKNKCQKLKLTTLGFTLIELLAVIVILAIIALIAVPIVLNMVESAKESANDRSSEFYLDAVNQAIVRKNLTEEFNPNNCEVDSDGNLICDGELLEIDIDNAKPTSGKIDFENNKITVYGFYINDKYYTNATDASCFETKTSEFSEGLEIVGYKCSDKITDVIIPFEIDKKPIVEIGGSDMLDGAFQGCNLTSVIIPSSVTYIGAYSFGHNKLTSVTIPNSVTSIDWSAFVSNSLGSIVIPSSVKSMLDYAFAYNGLKNITILGKNSLDEFVTFSELIAYPYSFGDLNITFVP